MREWLEIINEFLTIHNSTETRIVTYLDEPMLLIDTWNANKFLEGFNKWFESTDDYKWLEKEKVILTYDEFFLDAIGAEYGYDSEYSICYECGQAIHTYENSDKYWMTDGAILCEKCTIENAEAYIYEHLVYNYDRGIPKSNFHINTILSETELKEYGFKKYSKEYEVGFYGTYDDPYEILNGYVCANRDTDYIINLVSCNPFETRYQIWKRNNKEMDDDYKKTLVKIALEIAMETNEVGSITREDMRELHRRLDYEPYCERLEKAYEDLTEEDEEEIAFMKARDAGYEV